MNHIARNLTSSENNDTWVPPSVALHAPPRIALVGGFAPRRCGIATFTTDIYNSLKAASKETVTDVYAMESPRETVRFDPAVYATIVDNDPASYIAAAEAINSSGASILWLQHEFGLFGGPAGNMILELVTRVAAPLIVTLHTVLSDPDEAQRAVMNALVGRSAKLIVMSDCAASLLEKVYGADKSQIVLVHHGVPDRPFGREAAFKRKLGFDGKKVLMTFGLISPGKGIETMISALPAIVAEHPDVIYSIVGATHPNLIAHEGEAYRDRLKAQAMELGVADHIHWIDAFLDNDDLLDLIEAADIYVTPYPGAAQATSGTLSYAVALGKAVVSTPYVHASELLANDHGILVPFNDSAALSREIGALLAHPDRLANIKKRAYARGRGMIWSEFARRSMKIIHEIAPVAPAMSVVETPGIEGLLRICDDTGILQHSVYGVPDRAHGYCVDDNARALMLANRLGEQAEPYRTRMSYTFAAFVESAWNNDTRHFRNFMGFARNWLEDIGSQDSCGRTLWALGTTAHEGLSASLRQWASKMFLRCAPSAKEFHSIRSIAFAMLGADKILAVDPHHAMARDVLASGVTQLLSTLRDARKPDWIWFEDALAYDNCRLSEALIRGGLRLGRIDAVEQGIETLEWILQQQTSAEGHFRPVGSESFGRKHMLPLPFDQQPVEIWAAIDAASAALEATGEPVWIDHAFCAYSWFTGNNDRGIAVGDPVTGTCFDGITPRGVNLNQGAESVLAYQLASCAMQQLLTKTETKRQ